MPIRHEIVKPTVGALVHAEKRDLRDAEFARDCLDLLDERAVLVFPGIGVDDDEQLAFTDLLGERDDFARKAPGGEGEDSDFYKVTLDPDVVGDKQYVLATYFWHMDGVTVREDPPKATLLSARQIAPDGGQTDFASTAAAFAALAPEVQAQLEDLRTYHSVFSGVRPLLDFSVTPESWGGVPSRVEHPLVYTDESGHKSMLLGVQVEEIAGMNLPESRALIARLMEWATQLEFRYRHEWSVGDLVIWKNLSAMHRVIPYAADSGRLMHRTSLAKLRVPA